MLVTFRTDAYADITMLGDVAVELLKLMGHSGTVPSAMMPEDIPAALERLEAGLAEHERAAADSPPADAGDDEEDEDAAEPHVSLRNRAFPLRRLLEAAHREHVPVMWDG